MQTVPEVKRRVINNFFVWIFRNESCNIGLKDHELQRCWEGTINSPGSVPYQNGNSREVKSGLKYCVLKTVCHCHKHSAFMRFHPSSRSNTPEPHTKTTIYTTHCLPTFSLIHTGNDAFQNWFPFQTDFYVPNLGQLAVSFILSNFLQGCLPKPENESHEKPPSGQSL